MTYLKKSNSSFLSDDKTLIPFFSSARLTKIREKNYQILWPEWWNQGREIEQMKYVIAFLRDFCNCNIFYCSQFNPLDAHGKNFDFAILPGVGGARSGIIWATAIFVNSKIPLYCAETEGLYRSEEIEEFVWGHLKSFKSVLWSLKAKWSQQFLDWTISAYPYLKQSSFVSGSLGIDRYAIKQKLVSISLGKEMTPKFSFGIALNDYMTSYYVILKKESEKVADEYLSLLNESTEIIFRFIIANPDNVFCIKPHPGDSVSTPHPLIEKVSHLDNVHIYSCNTPIELAIESSMCWIVQNSTSCVEALALRRPVFKAGNMKFPFACFSYIPSLHDVSKLRFNYDFAEYLAKFQSVKHVLSAVHEIDGLNHLRFCSKILQHLEDGHSPQIRRRLRFDYAYLIRTALVFYFLKLLYVFKLPYYRELQSRFILSKSSVVGKTLDTATQQLVPFYKSFR